VWCLKLTGFPDRARELTDLLSSDERARADAFHSEAHRYKFALARGALRLLLGSYLAVDPASIQFGYGMHGKPFVRSASDLKFNIAHSGDLALYAISFLEVGIDIEQMRPLPDLMKIAHRFFSAAEAIELAGLTGDARASAFHHCWARKEAYIKAVGAGLSLPLESFRVTVLPSEAPRIKEIRGHPGLESQWLLLDLAVADGYASALVVQAPGIDLWTSRVLEPSELHGALKSREI
jgi:4'-phosphopantetheinyl transferase